MIKKLTGLLAAILVIGVGIGMTPAIADEGKVIAAIGEVNLVRDGKVMPASRGTVVRAGDLIQVAAESAAQVRMSDESIIALASGTEFRIIEYEFTREKPAEGRALFSLIKGAFRTVTGVIGLQARDNYAVKAGVVATIGIRGTHYRLRLCDGDCGSEDAAAPENGLYGGVTDGRIGITNESGTDEFGADEYFFVADAMSRPERLPGPPDLLIDRANFLAKIKRDGAPVATATPTPGIAVAASPAPALGALEALSSLTLQQFRPTDTTATPDQLAHVSPLPLLPTDGFVNVGGSGEIRGQIVWLTNADIDLHMLTPTGGTVFYGNPVLAIGGATAQLDHDNLGGIIDVAPNQRIENIIVTGTQIPVGLYTFSAHSFSGNNNGLPTTVQIRVTGDGSATSLTDTAVLSSGQISSSYIVDYKGAAVAPVYSTQLP